MVAVTGARPYGSAHTSVVCVHCLACPGFSGTLGTAHGGNMKVISTAEVPAEDRFGFWRDVNATLWAPYDLHCEPQLRTGFEARVRVSQFGPVQASLLTSMPHSINRTPKLIRRSDPEMFKLGCIVRGGGTITQEGQSLDFHVGDLKLYDTSSPYLGQLAFPVSQVLLLRFPRSLLPLPPKDLRRLSAGRIPVARGVGALSSQFMLQLAHRMDELTPAETARLSILTLDVLTAALADALDAQAILPPDTRRRALMAQIHAFIGEYLGDADLTPDAIAAAHHISLRYLHKLFHEDGHTVAGWIRKRRLEHCRRELASPHLAARPIHAIAARWGFANPAHFSQMFRSAYGLSPRQFRQQRAQTVSVSQPGSSV